jgi:hypothetical protein
MQAPLPYHTLKEFYNGPGYELNPFFGRWRQLSGQPQLSSYIVILDIVNKQRYDRPYITEGSVTRLAPYFVHHRDQTTLSFGQVQAKLAQTDDYIHADTVEGSYLLVAPFELAKDAHALAAEAYKTYASAHFPANRTVNASDRQIHWVWFRRTPTWRLTEEILLRAASWIELNPGYTFHLWTGMNDAEELADFLGNLTPSLRTRYFDSEFITVHYEEEFRTALETWFRDHLPAMLPLFTTVWGSTEKQDIVMKTDYARNILLSIYGGVYADFNDLVCLAPIEPVLEAHAGQYIGVTDNTSTQNASNYFMYAAKENTEWLEIVKRCTTTLEIVHAGIHSQSALQLARDFIQTMVRSDFPDLSTIQPVFPAGFISVHSSNHFLHSILVALHRTIKAGQTYTKLYTLDQSSLYGRYKKGFLAETISILRGASDEILSAALNIPEFEIQWRYAVAHIYLRSIMYCSNLPIFCREKQISLHMLPFSYLLRYSCLLSFIGHIGDGTSYGGEVTKSTSIRKLLGR